MDLSKNLHSGGAPNASVKPNSPEGKVEESSDHVLRNVSNCFTEGAVVIYSSEEVAGGEEGGGNLTSKLQSICTPSVVFSKFRECSEIIRLEGFDELLWNFEMPRDGERLTVIVRSVSSSLCHVSVGESMVEGLVGELSIMILLSCPAHSGPN